MKGSIQGYGAAAVWALAVGCMALSCSSSEDAGDSAASGGATSAGGAGVGGSAGLSPGSGGAGLGSGGTQSGAGGFQAMGGMASGAGGSLTGGGGSQLGSGGLMAAGGTLGSGGEAMGDGGPMGAGGSMAMDLGEGDGQDVITIGDSYMLLIFTGIQVSLERISVRDYRNFAIPGTRIDQIINQYSNAKAADPDIKTVVMTGGGNDILGSTCANETCLPIVDEVQAKITNLLTQMGQDGVEDVVIVGYGYPADETRHSALDYSRELSTASCLKTGTPRCHFIYEDLDGQISGDGIHPTSAGYDLLGQRVWDLMQAEGMRR